MKSETIECTYCSNQSKYVCEVNGGTEEVWIPLKGNMDKTYRSYLYQCPICKLVQVDKIHNK